MTDRPWEGNACFTFTIFQDENRYRMYYRGWHFVTGKKLEFPRRQVTCYAESLDGIHWYRPQLGLVEFEGSKRNNILPGSAPKRGYDSELRPFQGRKSGGLARRTLQGLLLEPQMGALRLEVGPTPSTGS